MKKYISHFWYAGGIKEFNTKTGSVSDAPDLEWGKTDFGSVWKQNGKYFVFHNDEESLILQQKNNIWRVTPDYTVSLRGYYFIRNFKIKYKGKKVFSIWYKPKGLFFWIIDPTYDAIDTESDDFFLYVKNMWKSWEKRHFSEYQKHFMEKTN